MEWLVWRLQELCLLDFGGPREYFFHINLMGSWGRLGLGPYFNNYIIIYMKEESEGICEHTLFPPAGLFSKRPQQPVLGQPKPGAWVSMWPSAMGGKDPTTWGNTCCFLGCQRTGSWDEEAETDTYPPLYFILKHQSGKSLGVLGDLAEFAVGITTLLGFVLGLSFSMCPGYRQIWMIFP